MLLVVQRILLIQLKRLGDFLLTVPVVPVLRSAFPAAELVFVVPAAAAELARCVPGVNRVIPFQAGSPNLETWASALAGEWDACLDFTGSDRSAFLTKLSRATHRIGHAKHARGLRRHAYTALSPASVRDLHTVEFHLALLKELGLDPVALGGGECLLQMPCSMSERVQAMLEDAGVQGPYAIVHPGTVREEKFWLDGRWAEVCAHLHQTHRLPVVLTGTGDGLEQPHLAELKRHLQVPVTDFTGQLSLVEFAALVAGSELVAGVDSMAMHLAALFGRPQVALFGPTNPFHWRPRHGGARIITPFHAGPDISFKPKAKKGSMAGISTAAVTAALDSLIG